MYVYWDTVASIDFQSGQEYIRVLKSSGLYRGQQHPGSSLDNAYIRRVWRSNINFDSFFRRGIARKLAAGELIIFNNCSWTHSATGWSPGSGSRTVVAAFS